MSFSLSDYRELSEIRYRIRRYLEFSERAARDHGVEPQQHQLLLALKGLPPSMVPNVGALAKRLCLRHHSTVELVNRSVKRGMVVRLRGGAEDKRLVLLELTRPGEEWLDSMDEVHSEELHTRARAELTDLGLAPCLSVETR